MTIDYDHLRRDRVRQQREIANARQAATVAARSLAPRGMDPEPGWWLTTKIKEGPLVPACIRWVETMAEPGNPENDMAGTRSPHLAAFILHDAVPVNRVWFGSLQAISETEYDEWMRKWDDELIINPGKRVDLTKLPPIRAPRSQE